VLGDAVHHGVERSAANVGQGNLDEPAGRMCLDLPAFSGVPRRGVEQVIVAVAGVEGMVVDRTRKGAVCQRDHDRVDHDHDHEGAGDRPWKPAP
jgi:hypothetical protein